MSELTTPIRIDIPGVGSIESADLYLKSEADKVIAHHKHKRCLAMAKLAVKDDYAPWNMKWHKRWLELAEKFKEGIQNGMR